MMNVPGYERLQNVLQRAYDQAARTKGAERHANNLPFHEQPMQTIAASRGIGFLLGQADKKSIEAQGMLARGEVDKAAHELIGAINYIAGAVIFAEAAAQPKAEAEPASGLGECDCDACALRRTLEVAGVTVVVERTDDEDDSDEGSTLADVIRHLKSLRP